MEDKIHRKYFIFYLSHPKQKHLSKFFNRITNGICGKYTSGKRIRISHLFFFQCPRSQTHPPPSSLRLSLHHNQLKPMFFRKMEDRRDEVGGGVHARHLALADLPRLTSWSWHQQRRTLGWWSAIVRRETETRFTALLDGGDRETSSISSDGTSASGTTGWTRFGWR